LTSPPIVGWLALRPARDRRLGNGLRHVDPGVFSSCIHRPSVASPVVLVRPATTDDLDAMVDLMFAEPSVEQIAFMPSIEGARRFSRAAWRAAGMDEFLVADDGGEVVGFAWVSDDGVSLRQGARAAVIGWGILGPLRLAVKGWPRQLVEITMPPGPKLIELQTHPSRRGTGVGTALLREVIQRIGERPLSFTP